MRIVWSNLEKSGSIIHFNYHNNEKVSWEICSSCEKVEISTVLFDTERCCDYLRIEGQKYSGRASINQIVPKNFTVKFESDYSVTGRGFYLQWNCIEQSKIKILTSAAQCAVLRIAHPTFCNRKWPNRLIMTNCR